MENAKAFIFFKSLFPLDIHVHVHVAILDQHGFIFGGGGDYHTRIRVLGEGGDEGDTKLTFSLILTYLRSVLIFIKQYTDSMCLSSIFS